MRGRTEQPWREVRDFLGWILVSGLAVGLVYGLAVGLVYGLFSGLTYNQIITRTIPNEGIQRSLRNALIICLTIWLGLGLVYGPAVGLFSGLAEALFSGLAIGLMNGGFAYLKHYVLRFLLWRNDYAPWNYIRFLDYASERVFLRKVGGGYIFTHRLIMEYFATLQPTNQAQQPQTA